MENEIQQEPKKENKSSILITFLIFCILVLASVVAYFVGAQKSRVLSEKTQVPEPTFSKTVEPILPTVTPTLSPTATSKPSSTPKSTIDPSTLRVPNLDLKLVGTPTPTPKFDLKPGDIELKLP